MEENLETLATYEPVGWENAEITKEATVTIDGIEYEVTPRIVSGKTPVNATNLSHMDDAIQENREAINDLYNGGATTSEIVIDTEEPPAEKEKIWINPDEIINNLGSEVVDTLDGNETNKAPSVNVVNDVLKGIVLFNDDNGKQGDLTLSDSAENYTYIDIIYGRGIERSYTRIYKPNGKKADLYKSSSYKDGDNYFKEEYFCKYLISGTTMTCQNTGCLTTKNSSIDTNNDVNLIIIFRIIGYK